jgi:hypothetical protein
MEAGLAPLPDMSDVDVTNPVFRAGLVTAGRFIARANLTDEVVLGAGHDHFFVGANEGSLEEADALAHLFTTRVVPLNSVSPHQEVAWRFTNKGKAVPTTWSAQSKGTNVMSSNFREILAQVGAFLAQEGLTNTLVMKVPGTSIPLGEGQVLREYTNAPARIQMTVADVLQPGEEKFAADWRFDPQGVPVLRQTCWCITHKDDK